MSSRSRTAIQHQRIEQKYKSESEQRQKLRETIEKCSRALSQNKDKYYLYIVRELLTEAIPIIETLSDRDLVDYDETLSDHDEWDWTSLRILQDKYDTLINVFTDSSYDPGRDLSTQARGYIDTDRSARTIVEGSLKTVGAIAEELEVISGDMRKRITVNGLAVKLGEQKQRWDSNLLEDPVNGITMQAGTLKTLFVGGTGMGKSTGLEREAEDFYLSNFLENGLEYKVIDLVDLGNGENWVYDIPQKDKSLKHILENKLDIDVEVPFEDRNLEIYVPLTKGVTKKDFPYDTEAEEFEVEFFTIPASEIRKPLLVQMIVSRLTPQQEDEIRLTYDEVDEHKDDWALIDLADAIRTNDDLSEKDRNKGIRVLRALQNMGFIRTKQDPHTIDWASIQQDTETITLFSQARMDSMLAKVMCVSVLLDTIIQSRKTDAAAEWPEANLLMRELWQITPHSRRDEFDERTSALQETIGKIMSSAFRRNRHIGLHVTADTQEVGDLLKPVREMFNRYVVYDANYPSVDNIFSWTSNDRKDSFWRTLTARKGEAGIVGQVEPAVKNQYVEFLSPVVYSPPTHHHFDKDNDTLGWNVREKHLDRIELRKPDDVSDDIPDSLTIPDIDVADDDFDVSRNPIQAFVEKCIEYDSGENIAKEDVRRAYNSFRLDHGLDAVDFNDRGENSSFGRKLSNAIKDQYDRDLTNTTYRGTPCYRAWRFTWLGEQYYESRVGSLDDASEVIDDRAES